MYHFFVKKKKKKSKGRQTLVSMLGCPLISNQLWLQLQLGVIWDVSLSALHMWIVLFCKFFFLAKLIKLRQIKCRPLVNNDFMMLNI